MNEIQSIVVTYRCEPCGEDFEVDYQAADDIEDDSEHEDCSAVCGECACVCDGCECDEDECGECGCGEAPEDEN